MNDTQTLEGAVALLRRAWPHVQDRLGPREDQQPIAELNGEIRNFLALPVSPDLPADAPGEGLRKALEPFARFCSWVEAVTELHGDEPLKDSAVVAQLMGGGGSDYIWMSDLRAARAALAAEEAQ